jgi:hypothetical protein
VILREQTGHTGHRRIAADLLIMEGLDWDEGELLDKHSAICALVIGPRFWWTNLGGQVNPPGIVTDDVSRTAGRRTICNQPAGAHTQRH